MIYLMLSLKDVQLVLFDTMAFFTEIKLKFWLILLTCFIILILIGWKGEIWFGANANNVVTNIVSAIISGVLVGIYFDIATKQSFHKEMEELLSINTLVSSSGIEQYHHSWDSVDLTSYIKQSRTIDIYVYYGSTVFNDYQAVLEEFLKLKGRVLRVFILDEQNKFLEASADLWSISDPNYSFQNVILKSKSTVDLLTSIHARLLQNKSLKGRLELYKVTKHPINFSFYRFDNRIIVALNKLSHHKTPKPPVLVLRSSKDKTSLFQRIVSDFSSLEDKSHEFLKRVI